jgi:hypothetical protein
MKKPNLLLIIFSLLINYSCNNAPKANNEKSEIATIDSLTNVRAGAFSINVPNTWQISTGSEEEQIKSEMMQGVLQMIDRYQNETGMAHDKLGIKDFTAVRIKESSGWCIMYNFTLPEQKDYYETMKEDTKKKLDWGLQQGVFVKVIENGIVSIGEKKAMKTIVQSKDGGRMITITYWSSDAPTFINNLIIMESKIDVEVKQQINDVCNSLQIH